MMEILKNKTMIGFILFVMAVAIIDPRLTKKVNVSNETIKDSYVVYEESVIIEDSVFTYNK